MIESLVQLTSLCSLHEEGRGKAGGGGGGGHNFNSHVVRCLP